MPPVAAAQRVGPLFVADPLGHLLVHVAAEEAQEAGHGATVRQPLEVGPGDHFRRRLTKNGADDVISLSNDRQAALGHGVLGQL